MPLDTNWWTVSCSVSRASASSDAVRRAAAAGLFSSWASPAESVPRAASFSCWRTLDSAACAIGAISRTAVRIASGVACRNARKLSASHVMTRAGVLARPVATAGSPVRRLDAPE
jgi:hypothetical protein